MPPPPWPALWQRPIALALAGVFLVLFGGISSNLVRPRPPRDPPPITRFPIVLPEGDEFSSLYSSLACTSSNQLGQLSLFSKRDVLPVTCSVRV